MLELRAARVRSEGDGLVEIVYELQPDRLAIEVVDEGEGFDPDEPPSTTGEELSEGGLGIAIIRAIADEFEIGRTRRAAARGFDSRSYLRR